MKELKRVSNLWLKKEHPLTNFEWQGGYADFSVSQSNLEQVKRYIVTQEEHLKKGVSRMRFARFCGGIGWNGMNDIFGTDATALRLGNHSSESLG